MDCFLTRLFYVDKYFNPSGSYHLWKILDVAAHIRCYVENSQEADVIILSSPWSDSYGSVLESVAAVLLKGTMYLPVRDVVVTLESIAVYSLSCYPDRFLS